jgi:hypothetical protein
MAGGEKGRLTLDILDYERTGTMVNREIEVWVSNTSFS